MRITTGKDLRIATTHGSVVLIQANQIREVSESIGSIALQMGAKRLDDTVQVEVRARNEEGHFVADDPSTPDVNEAYEIVEVPKDEFLETIADAMQDILTLGDPNDFKGNGEPKAAAVKKALGQDTDADQRAAAWAIVLER
jgi:hypothetical protein